jgi:RNA polymerase sigma factor (sigma-70 family)
MKDRTIIRSANIQRYFVDIAKPKYDPIKDDKVMRDMFQDRQQFRDLIINSNIRLVATIAKEYDNADRFMDFNQVGIEGLLEAFEKYDPSQKAKFSSYAAYWIKARMSMLCREIGLIQKSNQGKIGSKAIKFQEQFYAKNMREATSEEIVEYLKENCGIDIHNADEVLNVTVKSISEKLGSDPKDDGTQESNGEFAIRTATHNGYEDVIEQEDLSDAIQKMMSGLSAREKDFVIRHICNEESYDSIAENEGYSIERVRQIVINGLKKMKGSEFAKTRFACYLK